MELEVEEQNKTPIIKIREVGAKLAVKLASFLLSFFLLQIFMNCLLCAMYYARQSHIGMNETWS